MRQRCAGNAKLWVRAPFRAEKLTPAAKLDRLRLAVRPIEATLAPLPGPRDALPDGRTAHALVLSYKFSLAEDGKVTPTLPMLNRWVEVQKSNDQAIQCKLSSGTVGHVVNMFKSEHGKSNCFSTRALPAPHCSLLQLMHMFDSLNPH